MSAQISTSMLGMYLQAQLANSLIREFSAKSHIYTSGQDDCNIYVIGDGIVKVQRIFGNGKSCILSIYSTGDIFGESSILQAHRNETAVAMSTVQVYTLPYDHFMKVLAADGLVDEWIRYTAAVLQEQRDAIALFAVADSQQRLAAVLLMLASKIGIRNGASTLIPCRLTQEELAQMVGTTRSRIGVFLKAFERAGLLRISHQSNLILDKLLLRDYLDRHLII
jgi:CRP/FNR family transcriptional regulator, cyclic AMP receptor protein